VTARETTLQPPGDAGNLIIGFGGDPIERQWQYWTRNKLSILAGYFPAFNIASKKSPERLYIDLMAGDPFNRDAQTGRNSTGPPGSPCPPRRRSHV
jgi:hypothetical protein